MALGKIEFTASGKTVTAELGEDGVWVCEDRLVARGLNSLFNLNRDYRPSEGARGALCLYQAAEAYGGKVVDMNVIVRDEISFDETPEAETE